MAWAGLNRPCDLSVSSVTAPVGQEDWLIMKKFSKHTPEQIAAKLEKARSMKASFSTAVSRGVKGVAKATGPEVQQLLIELFNLRNVYSACYE